jgi:hypothetical protein
LNLAHVLKAAELIRRPALAAGRAGNEGTDAVDPHVFVVMGAGRCPFRLDDLLELADLLDWVTSATPAGL